ncbi:MAG TPA: SPFH domain-containing protein [Solirubrobacteraceae bacterium]|nr:SPFH domain-containing protein [Solirubrobacteraceae bacterium]
MATTQPPQPPSTPIFEPRAPSSQRPVQALAGPAALLAILIGLAAAAGLVIAGGGAGLVAGIALAALAVIACAGFIVLQPNESQVLILFGRYTGTVLRDGWFWVSPLTAPWRQKISLRVRNFQSERVKVNDAAGSPIEIGGVVVWRIADTAKAVFDVEDFEQYVTVQSESALRHLATQYPYDDFEEGTVSLRGGTAEVSAALHGELQERLGAAGIEVLEARITHLAYAPEIAEAMLRRQQASAILAARKIIVAGAVGLVDMALHEIGEQGIVELDEERKAAMVSNLMVVLAGDRGASPVINAGSLYS